MWVQSCSGSGWDQGLVLSFLLVSFFEQGLDIGQPADKLAAVAVLDTGPSHWTHISYVVQNPVVSIHLCLIPTFTFGSSTSVLYLPEKSCCSNGIEQEPKSLPERLLNSVCNGSVLPDGWAHHTTGKATRMTKATHALLHKERGGNVVEKHHRVLCSHTALPATAGWLWDTMLDVPGQVVLQPYNRNTMCLHIVSQTRLSWCHLYPTPTDAYWFLQDHQPRWDESSLGSQLTRVQLQSTNEMSTSMSARTQANKSVFRIKTLYTGTEFFQLFVNPIEGPEV